MHVMQLTLLTVFALLESVSCLPLSTDSILETTTEVSVEAKPVISDLNVTDQVITNLTSATREGIDTVRPGMTVRDYDVSIHANIPDGTFSGTLLTQVTLTDATAEDELAFHFGDDLTVTSVEFAVSNSATFNPVANSYIDDGFLFIETGETVNIYTLRIRYEGTLNGFGGLYLGSDHMGNNYVSMNLHPTHARNVFPCIDEPSQRQQISFQFHDFPFNFIHANSLPEDNNPTHFRALEGPPHLWGMVSHSFSPIGQIPVTSNTVILYARPGVSSQNSIASDAISSYFTNLQEYTGREYSTIQQANQAEQLSIIALPDNSKPWFALSTVCIWEPHILMVNLEHSIMQRKTGLIQIADSLSGQWLGYNSHPNNWKNEWIITGLRKHVAYEMVRMLKQDQLGVEDMVLNIDSIFVADVIQEALLYDAYYLPSTPLEPEDDIFEEDAIRDHVFSKVVQNKSPALIWMLKRVLQNGDTDYIQRAVQDISNTRALESVDKRRFYASVISGWPDEERVNIDDIEEYVDCWINNFGYPFITVMITQTGVAVSKQPFGFSQGGGDCNIPLTYSISHSHNFENLAPIHMLDNSDWSLPMSLDEDKREYVLFNLQGQGFYRVNYDMELWERIIEALEDPESREQIHPLNRATLVDDALNLARAKLLDYEIAFRVVLSMEHEVEYPVWKAFIRNMDFLRTRLVAEVENDDDLDPDIYLRMVRRTIVRIENELGFHPDPALTEPLMNTLTRGMVMDHACRANYQPCIAAAIDWFWNPVNNEVVNPNIPMDLRPAVYCTMVREGGDDIIEALQARLEIEPSLYERLVILESMACSRDNTFIDTLLLQTISADSALNTEERSRIYAAVVKSSTNNAERALNFMILRAETMKKMYGGLEKFEELLILVAEHVVESFITTFDMWIRTSPSLEDCRVAADRAMSMVDEHRLWYLAQFQDVYDWIDENDTSTMAVSLILLVCTSVLTLIIN